MAYINDPVAVINISLCLIVVVLGFMGFRKNSDKASLAIGAAFGLFAISHLITLMGVSIKFSNFVIIIRMLAYLIVAIALVNAMRE
jgi:uncharacterized membrane protein (UPF0136 family)